VETFSQANTFVAGDAIRYDIPSNTWVKAQADSAENSEVAGVVSSAAFNTFDLTYSGYINVSALSGVSAPVLFLDSTIAGGLTASPPSAIGTVVKPVLTKTTNGAGYIVTNYLGTQIGGSSTVAIDEIQPVGTVVPFAGSTIPDSWLECNGASYAVGAYPYLYSKLQYSSDDRAPAYGHVAVLTVGAGPFNIIPSVGSHVISDSTPRIRARVIATTATTCTVQTVPVYSTTTKNFINNNVVFGAGLLIVEGGAPSTVESIQFGTFLNVSAVATTHFNTPDLRGRFALGVNTARLPTINDLENDTANNSAISGNYSMGSQGGEEKNSLPTAGAATSTGTNCVANVANNLLNNIPPYTVVRYIIKASPYTRAAIIDGIDIPYTSLLVGDLRDGTLRPSGSGEDLVFKTNDGSSGVERMRLTNTPTNAAPGSLVVGESSLTSGYSTSYRLLDVAKTTGNGGGVVVTRSASVSLESGVDEGSGSGIIGTRTTHPLIFRTNTTERIRVDANGQANIRSTVNSTSTTTGGLTLGGGLGMASNLTVGGGISAAGGITFSGLTRITDATPATSPTVAAFTVVGGIGAAGLHVGAAGQSIAGPLNVTGETRVDSAAGSSSTTSGALRVVGGVGIQGALYVGGITTAGGISMGGALTVGGGITAARLDCSGEMKSGSVTTGTFSANSLSAIVATPSTTTGTGALVVAGGAGIAGALNVGGGITAARLDLGTGAIKTTGSLNCGNIVSTGTFQATSLNASTNTTSTSTSSGSLVLAGGAGIAGALNVGGGITAAGNLNIGAPRNYTNGAGYSPHYMMRGLGSHTNTKIQLVATGNSDLFGGNTSLSGAALLMWAGEPNVTYSGCGIGANLTTSPGGSVPESRQFTEQAQTFIRFTDNGRIGFHTSAAGVTASMTPSVAILSTGGLDVASGIVSTSTSSGALVVTGAGGAGIGGALNVGGAFNGGATASFGGNVGIGGNASVDRLTISANTTGYTGGILNANSQSGSYLRIIPLGTSATVTGWTNSSVVFEGVPAASGNTIIGSYYNDLVFQTGGRANRMRINLGGALIHNGTTSGAVGAISFVPSSVNPIYNRIVFGGDNTGYGLAIASQHNSTNAITDRLVIYDNGNIKIPITTASTSTTTGALTVAGGLGVADALYAGNALRVVGAQNYGGSANSGIVTIGNASNSRQINLGVSDTNSVAYIEGWVPGTGGSHLVLQPTGGRVGIGKSAPAQALDVVGNINASGVGAFTRISVSDGSSDLYGNSYTIAGKASTLGPTNNGGVIGTTNNQTIYGILGLDNTYAVYAHGPILSSANITAFSDIRNKENISTIENGLSKTLTLNGVLYTDKETQERRTGLIAQDVLAVLPEAVHTTADGYYSLAYGNLVGLLVEAIRELNAKVDSLSAKVETLSSGASE
jgi:hypothetical protein